MGWFARRKTAADVVQSAHEQAVIVHYALSDDQFGSADEREAVYALQDRLMAAIDARGGVGEFDGNEFGGGEVVLYAYGPDALRLFAAMESTLRAFPARPAHAVLRLGEATDPSAEEIRIDL
ncbi:MAG: hypothetical protein ACRDPJ_12255 [Nocardioidaceae bacterium]